MRFYIAIDSLELQYNRKVMKQHPSYQQKIAALKESIDDPLFQADLRSMMDDFQAIDLEPW